LNIRPGRLSQFGPGSNQIGIETSQVVTGAHQIGPQFGDFFRGDSEFFLRLGFRCLKAGIEICRFLMGCLYLGFIDQQAKACAGRQTDQNEDSYDQYLPHFLVP
jgi:hypothetical protein